MSIIQEALRRKSEDEGRPLPPPLPPSGPARRRGTPLWPVGIGLLLVLAAAVMAVQWVRLRSAPEAAVDGEAPPADFVFVETLRLAPEPAGPEAAAVPVAEDPPVSVGPEAAAPPLPDSPPAEPAPAVSATWPALTADGAVNWRGGGLVQFRDGPPVEVGQSYRGVRVVAIARDEITLEFEGERRTVRVGQSID